MCAATRARVRWQVSCTKAPGWISTTHIPWLLRRLAHRDARGRLARAECRGLRGRGSAQPARHERRRHLGVAPSAARRHAGRLRRRRARGAAVRSGAHGRARGAGERTRSRRADPRRGLRGRTDGAGPRSSTRAPPTSGRVSPRSPSWAITTTGRTPRQPSAGSRRPGSRCWRTTATTVTIGDSSFAVAGVDDLYTGDPDPEAAAAGSIRARSRSS